MSDGELTSRARATCHPANVMRSLASRVKPSLWDHPAVQAFFQAQLEVEWSPEYLRFESWLKGNPVFSPYRAEWSIYHETWQVAGQIDSLWFDTDDDQAVVMADWKRTRLLLTSDVHCQSEQAYQHRTGLERCLAAPHVPGPCRYLYDCAYNHYLVQQRWYAYIVADKYEVVLKNDVGAMPPQHWLRCRCIPRGMYSQRSGGLTLSGDSDGIRGGLEVSLGPWYWR